MEQQHESRLYIDTMSRSDTPPRRRRRVPRKPNAITEILTMAAPQNFVDKVDQMADELGWSRSRLLRELVELGMAVLEEA